MSEEATVSTYTVDDIAKQVKPLSDNGFVRMFQKLWRWWQGVWGNFADKHPKGSKLIYMIFFFIVFSEGVTIIQFLIMTFLPFAFKAIWDTPFVWPAVALGITDAGGNALNYAIFNEPVKFLTAASETVLASDAAAVEAARAAGYTLQALGLGNFIAFEIAVFIAQCINFPLQRNITYRSHGNPYFQAMWYFIGWLGISIFVNALWGICNPFMMYWNWNEVLIGLIKTVITGGLSMVIFFPIFLIIFPDNNKMAKKSRAKYEKLVAANAPAEQIEKAEAKMNEWEKKALLSNTDKELAAATSLANAKAVRYFAVEKSKTAAEQKAQAAQDEQTKSAAEAEIATYTEKLQIAYDAAIAAIGTKVEKQAAYDAARA